MADFIIRIHKAWKSRDMERSWSNVYEVMSGVEDFSTVQDMAEDIVTAEKSIHCIDVNFLEYSVSTWVPDSRPYDPNSFITVGLTGTGARDFSGPFALDYNVCLVVKRNAVTGRTGRLYYRGCLGEGDVRQAGDGRFEIDPTVVSGAAITQIFLGAYTTAMAPYVGAAIGVPVQLGLISKRNTVQVLIYRRPVVSLTLGGVTINKHKHRYFDRAP